MKVNTVPNLTEERKILDHHPHREFPAHGTLRKSAEHLLASLHRKKGKDGKLI